MAFEKVQVRAVLEGELTKALGDPQGSPMADDRMAQLARIQSHELVTSLRELYLKANPEEWRLLVSRGDTMCVGFGGHYAAANGLLSEAMKDKVRDLFKEFSVLRNQQKSKTK